MKEFTVTFNPQNKTIKVARGTDILSAAIRCGIVLAASCGGEGLCGKCKVIVRKGKFSAERTHVINEKDRKSGVVLGCSTIVESDLEVEIPKESLIAHEKMSHESEEFTKGVVLKRENKFRLDPLVRKFHIKLPEPTADDNLSDLDRILREIEPELDHVHVSASLASVKHLSQILRQSGFVITVTLGYKDDRLEILSVEPGDEPAANLGLAFDIGTTTVAGQLINLKTREILGSRIAFNRQAAYGSDIITRIIFGSEPDGMEKLNAAVLENINEMVEELASTGGASLADINAVTFAGNMTMMHLLLKIDPSNIRKAPYIPATTSFETIHASEIDVEANPKALASFLPGVSTYLGGDIVAGVLACGLAESDDISILADIGTNGEVVLGNREWMVGAAASAGPAFEGSGVEFGMKAVKGAIEKVLIDDKLGLSIGTIGAELARGICGSGYIDLLCQMLKRKMIGRDGKINRDLRSPRIRRRGEAGYEFVVAFKNETALDKDIVINEDDIENLKRSKGAIYSAITALLSKVQKDIKEVKKIYIAGGFGNYLNIENSVFIGLLPDVDRMVYEFVGNSSLAGSRMSLLSREAFKKTEEICKNITYVDLSSEPGYMDEYVAALFFPHTDIGRFPSVRL